jgi:hypothetical protein
MKTKNALLALAATGFLAFGAVAPAFAEDPAPAPDDSMKSEAPADPATGTAAPAGDQGDAAAGQEGAPAGDQGGEQK